MLNSNLHLQSDRMTSHQHTENRSAIESYSWSNRFLALAAVGILFLTMYPFELSSPKPYRGLPLFLGSGGKAGGPLDIFLNILLFMPFGFALGTKLLRGGKSLRTSLIYTLLVGALFSYAIELTQLYVPFRDSGWLDVSTNTTGSVIGGVAAFFVGEWVFGCLTAVQKNLRAWLAPRRLAAVLLIYFGVWCVASAFLTQKVSLSDWRTDAFLVFNNDATGDHPWTGHLARVEIWDRAIPGELAKQLTSSTGPVGSDDPVVNLDFGNQRLAAPGSVPPAGTMTPQTSKPPVISASPTLSDDLVRRLKQSNQFSIRVVLALPRGQPNGRILALSQRSGFLDFYLNQLNDELVFWFRTPITVHWHRNWRVPDALNTGEVHAALFSYDGAAFSSYIDGKQIENRSLGAQTALASFVRHLTENELKGYKDIFYALVFFPVGALLGIAVTRPFLPRADRFLIAAAGAVVPAIVFEWILTRASRAPFSPGNVAFSAMYVVLGLLWMHADGPLGTGRAASRRASRETASNL